MSHTFTRGALYELVWSEPMQALAKKLGLSDRGLAKICTAANIPVPPRGYWAKKQAGHKVRPYVLPPRALGQSDQVHVGVSSWRYQGESDDAIVAEPIPPPPTFEPDMDAVRAQAEAMVRRAHFPLRDSQGWHSQIAKLLRADEERARKQKASPYSWEAPIFNTPFEQRRLRILNALFIGLTRSGMHTHLSGKYGRDISITVGNTGVPITVDAAGAAKQVERERQGYAFIARGDKDRMQLSISPWWAEQRNAPCWEDRPGAPLERRLREIAAVIIVYGEQHLRDSAVRQHEWRIQRKAELEEKERQRRAEEERQRRELQAKREQARLDHLLGQARAYEQAQQIRAYVDAVRQSNGTALQPVAPGELQEWCTWALAQADRIDPIVSGAYRIRPSEPNE